MRFDVITLFPEWVQQLVEYGVIGRANRQGLMTLSCTNPRSFATDRHASVDARPYGGGPGMVMKPDVLYETIQAVKEKNEGPVVYLSPQGQVLSQVKLAYFASLPSMTILCGRYEGIDERVIDAVVDEECSIGDYVISGGELAAMVLIDGITRLLPDVLGHQESAAQDSFSTGLLDCPQYTRPEQFLGMSVPEVLTQGDHQAIAAWRSKAALIQTWKKRPDLIDQRVLSKEEAIWLEQAIAEQQNKGETA